MAPSRCAAETTPGPHPLCSLFTAGRIEAARQHHHHPPTRHRNEGLQNLPPSIHDQYTLKQLENSMETLVRLTSSMSALSSYCTSSTSSAVSAGAAPGKSFCKDS